MRAGDLRAPEILGVVFDPDFGYERYARWALDVPLFFVVRGKLLVNACLNYSGIAFSALLGWWVFGQVPGLVVIAGGVGFAANYRLSHRGEERR